MWLIHVIFRSIAFEKYMHCIRFISAWHDLSPLRFCICILLVRICCVMKDGNMFISVFPCSYKYMCDVVYTGLFFIKTPTKQNKTQSHFPWKIIQNISLFFCSVFEQNTQKGKATTTQNKEIYKYICAVRGRKYI